MEKKTCIETISEIGDLLNDASNKKHATILEHSKVKELANNLSESTGLTDEQALFFATVFYLNCKDKDATSRDIAEQLNIPLKKYPMMFETLDSLIDFGFVFKCESYVGRFDFVVTPEVKDAIFKGHAPRQENLKTDLIGFAEKIEAYEDHLKARRVTIDQAVSYYKRIANKNQDLMISHIILNKEYRDEEIIIIAHMFYNYLNKDFTINYNEASSELFRGYRERNYIKKSIMNKTASIIKNKIVEFDGENFENRELLRFTEETKQDLFGIEYNSIISENTLTNEGLILPATTPSVIIHLNTQEKQQLEMLSNSLMEDNYQTIIKTLSDKNLNEGICALFYGVPGSGKTESVLQIAKRTDRAIKKVDLSMLKDKYVGESEKRIRSVFVNYKKICKSSEKAPILLLNEADGIFSNRIKINSSVDQMNNTIQNIILEEMENFKGILIATTNLQFNFDKAFERRFLFKIKFTNPTVETLRKIIADKITCLNSFEVSQLAAKYKLTGGQVTNVSRKIVFDQILFNTPMTMDIVEKYFHSEEVSLFPQVKHNKITGFVVKKENQAYETE